MTHPSPRLLGGRQYRRRSATEPAIRASRLVGTLLIVGLITLTSRICAGYRRAKAGADDGSPTVETIGWVTFGFAIVVILGAILRDKLSALANSLPDSLDW